MMFSPKFLVIVLAVISKAVAYNSHWSEDDETLSVRDIQRAGDIYARDAEYASELETRLYARGYIQALLDQDLQGRDVDTLSRRADEKTCAQGHTYSKTLYQCPECRRIRDRAAREKKKQEKKDKEDEEEDKRQREAAAQILMNMKSDTTADQRRVGRGRVH